MVSTRSKIPAMEEIYGSLAAKEVPSNKAVRDIWIALIAPSSRAPAISAEAEMIAARASQTN